MAINFESIEDVNDYIGYLESMGKAIPAAVMAEKERLERENAITDSEYVFGTMAAHNPFMSEEKEEVVREMTEQLMSDAENASQPCLLLGKVQCGKTDTFLSIMGLCFDRGIDIAIVMTKGTNTLTNQTLNRLKKEFRFFKDNGTYDQKVVVNVEDIMDLHPRGGLSHYQLSDPTQKFIIVVKKEITNLKYMNDLFEKSEVMRSKKVLICDDEADFASRAYYKEKGDPNSLRLLAISDQIEALTKQPTYCRYLQITATPYSLYLQPDGTVQLREGAEASPWLPRYTGLVPIHSKYVGGHQYYELSEDENSMYSCLFQSVTPICMDILSARNEWYLQSNVHSENLNSLNYAIISYFFAAAVRSIQVKKKENRKYYSSCLIHCEVAKKNHQWQEELITEIIDGIKAAFLDKANADMHILDLESEAYDSLKKSNELGNKYEIIHEKFPSFGEVEAEVKRILEYNDYTINTVNSDEPVSQMLNEKGQLRLEQALNFFIGGSILDRGITIDNMLCFFYGRDPKKFQMDSVLQHARMYGARDKEDMACTRFFTTEAIYDVLKSINDIDSMMYDYLKGHRTSVRSDEFTSMVIGYDKRVNATAQNKYTPANTKVLKPKQRILPIGFQTGQPVEIADAVKQIDEIIVNTPDYANVTDKNPFFMMDYDSVVKIIHLMRSTYRYDEEYENKDYEWDENEMLTALDHCTFGTDGMVYVLFRPDREMSRERDRNNNKTNKTRWIDAPDDGRNDLRPSREKAIDRPVLILTRQNGNKEQGWLDAPFYWPVLVLPQNMHAGIFTINDKRKAKRERQQFRLPKTKEIPKEQILALPFVGGEVFFDVILGIKPQEFRQIKSTTASLYLAKNENNQLILVPSADPEKYYNLSSYNNGVFPFEMNKKFRYIYLRCSQDYSGSQALLKLKQDPMYELLPDQFSQQDTLHTAHGGHRDIEDDSLCEWTVAYNLGELVEMKLTPADEEAFKEYKKELQALNPSSYRPITLSLEEQVILKAMAEERLSPFNASPAQQPIVASVMKKCEEFMDDYNSVAIEQESPIRWFWEVYKAQQLMRNDI